MTDAKDSLHGSEKEAFKNYLEKSGVVDTLTKVLVELFEQTDKPSNPLDFIKLHLSGVAGGLSELESVRQENEALKKENQELRKKVQELSSKGQ
jgi:hypothetical protein